MKTILNLLALLALMAAASPCLGETTVERVSKERGKELGMEVRSTPGVDGVGVELEFKAAGALREFGRVELEINEGEKTVFHATLREERSRAPSVVVRFAADRSNLEKITLLVVASEGRVGGSGYRLRVKDFVDLAARAERREAVSKEDAIRLAKEHLRTEHPEMVVAEKEPTAEYLEKSPIDGKPVWVVGFVISPPKNAEGGFVKPYTQAVFVRSDGSVVLGPAAS